MSKLGFIKRHYKASLLFVASCLVLLSLGFNMIIPFFDKRFNQDKVAPGQKELEPLGVTYGTMPAAVTDSYEWNGITGYQGTDVIRLGTSQYYLIVYSGPDDDGWANTTQVYNNNGTIKKSIVDYLEWDTTVGSYPDICHVYDDIYALTAGYYKKVKTFSADDADGQIGAAVIDSLTLKTSRDGYLIQKITKVSGNMFAVAAANETYSQGWLYSMYISNTGMMAATTNDSVMFNGTYCRYLEIVSVDSDTVAIVYQGSGDDGYVCTYDINPTTGDITNTWNDQWEFDTSQCVTPTIKKISGNIYAISYSAPGDDLYVKTVTISTAGIITKSWIDTLLIDATASLFPTIFVINNLSVYGVSYKGNTDGWVAAFNMSATGTIGAATIDSLEFDGADCVYWAPVVWVNKSWYYVVYTGTGSDGWSCTVQIDTNYASPTFSNPSPANNSVGQALTPTCAITINDLNGDLMNLTWYSSPDGSTWTHRQYNASCANGTYRWTFAQASSYSLKYYWKVYINDGNGTHNVSNWYCFTTEDPPSQEPTWQSLFNSTLTFGNTTTGNESLFTSLLTFGNTTTTYKPLFTSTLTFGNTTTGHDSLFTSLLTFGNTTTTTSLFTSLLTFGNISSNNSLFTSLLTFGNITTKYASLFTSTLTFGNVSSGTWTSLFTSNLSFGNISSNHSFFTSSLSFGNTTVAHSLFTSLLTFGNTSVLSPATPYNLNLLVINPNPGNGTHNTNYLKSNASGLTTSIDIVCENFTTPPAVPPSSATIVIDGTPPANVPCLYNSSTNYTNVWDNTTGTISTTDLFVGQYKAGADYVTYRGFLTFDTSIIPDNAVIDNANVSLVILTYASLTDFNVTLQETKSPVPHDPLIGTDYNRHNFAGDFGSENTTGYTDDEYFNISLKATWLNYLIDKTGDTVFSIRSYEDIRASPPPNSEIIGFYAYSFVPFYPKLIISYHTPNPNWSHLVNLTWYSNSSGAWVQYNRTYVSHNCTVTVPAVNFSGVDTYFWHLEWESNHTNNGSSQIFTFTTVNASGGMVLINRDRTSMVWLLLGFIMAVMIYFGIKGKKKRNNGTGE